MQQLATRVFIASSLAFGVFGILMILTMTEGDLVDSELNMVVSQLMFTTVFIILPSFATSVALKYLS